MPRKFKIHFQKMDIEYQWTLLINESQCFLHAKEMYHSVHMMEYQHNSLKSSSVDGRPM